MMGFQFGPSGPASRALEMRQLPAPIGMDTGGTPRSTVSRLAPGSLATAAPARLPRDEHVLVAESVLEQLGDDAFKIVALRVNGVLIDDVPARAAAVKAKYRDESAAATKTSFAARVVNKATSIATKLEAKLKAHLPAATKAALDSAVPRPPRMLEGVYENAKLEVALTDGQTFAVDVPIIRRDDTRAVLQVSLLTNAAMMCCMVPMTGTIPALIGASTALCKSVAAYAGGRVVIGNAWARTTCKLVALGVSDCIPLFASITLTLSLLNTLRATERIQNCGALADMRLVAPLVAGVHAARPELAA